MGIFQNVVMRTLKRKIRELSGEKMPFIAGHKLLYSCNLRCSMCPFWRRPDDKLLTVEEERKMMDSLVDLGVSYMGFEGGEPFLRKDLPEILRLSHSRFHTSLVTNGWMLKEKINSVRDYIDYLFVSLDGVGETHDKLRGVHGSFSKAREGIEAASKIMPVSINSTITSENAADAGKILEVAEQLNVQVSFQIAYNYSAAEKMSPSATILKDTVMKLLEMKKEGAPIVDSREYFEAILSSWYGGAGWKCKPWLTINIDPQGRAVLPCYVLNEYTGSKKVWETDLRKTWNSIDWGVYETCNKCALSCYLEPSLFSWSNPGMVKERIIDGIALYLNK